MMTSRIERAVPPLGRFIDVDGTRLHYVDRGSGPPIVMIHGLSGALQNFTHSLTERLATSTRVIALDRPGAGYSRRPRGASAHLTDQATTIARFIEALGLNDTLVVGHSLGGAIALALALDHPHVARALALIAPLTQPVRKPPKPFAPLEIQSTLLRALLAYTIAVPAIVLTGRKRARAVFAPDPVPRDFAIAGGGLLSARPSQFFHASSDMIAAREDLPAIASRYGEIRIPVHVLFGRDDAVLDHRRHGEALRQQLGAEVTVVPGGHMLPVTQPQLCADWITSLRGGKDVAR